MLIKKLLEDAQNQLKYQGITSYNLDSKILLAHILKITREDFYKYDNLEINQEQIKQYLHLIQERKNHKPVAKILNKKEFYSLEFVTDLSTLDPRPDTETIIDTALEASIRLTKPAFLEIGTGTGCISISLLKNGDFAKSDAIDISEKALEICKKNLKKHNLENKLNIYQSDLFTNINKKYDIIISNPPYIETDEIKNLSPEVKYYDPISALDGGVDGLYFYKEIAKNSSNYLNKNGLVILEIGYKQKKQIEKIFKNYNFKLILSKKDLAKITRSLVFQINN